MIQTSGVKASIYWADFPSQYLATIRNENLTKLEQHPPITLHHTQPRSLLDPTERDIFLYDYVAVINYIKEGYCNTGHLRREGNSAIHRDRAQPDNQVPTETEG